MSQLKGSKAITYDEVITPDTLDSFLPDGGVKDANVIDYTILASDIALSMLTKNKNLNMDDTLKIYKQYSEGKNALLDTTTNLIGSEQALKLDLSKDYELVSKTSGFQQSSKELTKFISANLTGKVAGAGAAVFTGPAGAVTVDFFVGNGVSTKVDGVWDSTIGPNICTMKNHTTNDTVFLSSGKFDSVLKHHFENEDKNQSLSEIKKSNDSYTLIAQSDTGMILYDYKKSTNTYTFTKGATEDNIKEFLKYTPIEKELKLNIQGKEYTLIENYLHKENKPITENDLNNKNTMYAVLNNLAFLTKQDRILIQEASSNGLLKKENYSDKFIEDKLQKFNTLIKYDMYPSIKSINTNFAEDIKEDITHRKIEDAKHYEEDKGKYLYSFGKISEDRLYGSEKNDILVSGNEKDYLEGGKGNDYLNAGRGDDTYYYKLGDGDDIIYEGAHPKNRYGSGNDTLEFHKNNINLSMLEFKEEGKDLVIKIYDNETPENNGSITIKSWENKYNKIENFKIDNKIYTIQDIKEIQKQEKTFDEKINSFENFAKIFMQDTESKENIEQFQNKIKEIASKRNLNEKINSFENINFKDFTSNTYIDQILSNKRSELIENINTNQENRNKISEHSDYDYRQINTNTNQNNNTSVQMMN